MFACLAKSISCYAGARLAGEGPHGARNLAVALNARGGPGIVLASVTLDAGIIGEGFFTTLVLLALLTSVAAGSWLEAALRRDGRLLTGYEHQSQPPRPRQAGSGPETQGYVSAALEGLLVADFSRVLAGPLATMLLGDLGADVVKVEHPDGDETRGWGPPFLGDHSTYYLAVNRNKRSVALDLKEEAGRSAALALAGQADVVVENFKVGALDRLGLGFEQVRARNPGVVWCSISGFGSGEGAGLPGYDFLVQATSGLMSISGPAGEPTKVGVALVDVVTGLYALTGVLAALHARARTGLGQRVEVSLLGSAWPPWSTRPPPTCAPAGRRRPWATGIPASPRTRPWPPPTGRWWWRSATTPSSPASAGRWGWPGRRPIHGSPPTGPGSPTARRWRRCSRGS